MVAYTTTYNLKKPTVADDEDVWGGYLNDSMDIIDDVLDGTVPVTGIDINSGTLDNVVIGGATANTGTFTVLTASTSLGVTGNITVSGTVDGRDVATDGTKLDGIESGATADQTKADIDALGIAASTASTLATARNIALTGAVTGNVDFDGSGNVSISTTATADPTLTLSGDASGSATFTNLGNATLSVTVADDSHNHVISNVDGLQTALDAKSPLANPDFTGVASFGNMITVGNSGTRLSGGTDLLEIYGNTASFHMGVQDGSGRVQMRWNASRGTTPTYQVSSEPSARFEIVDVTSPTDSLWKIDYAAAGTAGNTISYSNIMSLGTSAFTYNGNTVWHAGNDGSGSGLDADTLDGVQGSSYLRSDADDTFSGNLTLSKDGQDVLNFSANDTNDARGISFNGRTALSADYNDGWLRINQLSEFTNGIYTPAGLRVDGTLQVASVIQHEGDTNTSISFGTDTITLATGGSSEITVNTTGVRLGDTGNGYFRPVSGNYGSIEIDGGGHTGWEGYSIGGRVVFMHDNSNSAGIYNDVNNEWMIQCALNGAVNLYHNNSSKLDTLSNGVSINGNLYTDGSNAEDYDALSGTSPTCNVDNAGAFSLTMTGNTTFTFSGADSGWSMGFVLQLTGNGSTVTWPSSVDWAGGTAPDAPASGETDIYVFWTRDGGTTWYGVQSIDAAA